MYDDFDDYLLDDYQQPAPQYERPSLLKRAFAFAGAYYLFSKLVHPKK